MNRVISRRFGRGLFSGLLMTALFVFGYSSIGLTVPVLAADDPPAIDTDTPKANPKSIAGSSKEVIDTTRATINKQAVEESLETSKKQTPQPQVRTDAEDVLNPESELLDFQATAYCIKGRTASGVNTRPGVIAADPRVLPLGTVVHIRAGRYTGTYTVLDTGGLIKGKRIDIFLPAYKEARNFGRQMIKVRVVSRGKVRRGKTPSPGAGIIAKTPDSVK